MLLTTATLDNDFDFYCFLKRNLPEGYRIVAEPQTSYYSEWLFCYKVYFGDDEIESFAGDFRSLPQGSLVQAAHALLAECGVHDAHWK